MLFLSLKTKRALPENHSHRPGRKHGHPHREKETWFNMVLNSASKMAEPSTDAIVTVSLCIN